MQHKGAWSPAGKDGRFQMGQHSCDWQCGQQGLSEGVEQLVFLGALDETVQVSSCDCSFQMIVFSLHPK